MKVNTIGVVGAGQMGAGIAHVAAATGIKVLLADADLTRAQGGVAGIRKRLDRSVAKGRMTEADAHALLDQITPVSDLEAMADADLVVEAVTEQEGVKNKIFTALDAVCPEHTILASNTSSIPITRMAAQTGRPDRFIGMHFMNPVPIMKLVEIIRGLATSEDTYARVKNLAESMGKVTVVSRDVPGFIVNRILMPMINEACVALYEGVASAQDIDTAMKLGTNQPMGPLTLADFIGLDTCLAIMEVLHQGTGDSKYRPSMLLRQYVDAGWLGRKTGRGFHDYREGS
ncbi:MAG: 3-hydroxybutyryl-CoA dehydrogenase [Myxococcota bacterium]|nr:3-hydroxybutyryl-CoA dehydrogenase [Myxococcota bacterium]